MSRRAADSRPQLTLQGARLVLSAASAAARRKGWAVTIAVVDAGGHLILLERMDGAHRGSIETAVQKARCAAVFERPTKAWEDAVAGGRTVVLSIPGVCPLQGGLPLLRRGRVLGGIGVGGATPQADEVVALAGVSAL